MKVIICCAPSWDTTRTPNSLIEKFRVIGELMPIAETPKAEMGAWTGDGLSDLYRILRFLSSLTEKWKLVPAIEVFNLPFNSPSDTVSGQK